MNAREIFWEIYHKTFLQRVCENMKDYHIVYQFPGTGPKNSMFHERSFHQCEGHAGWYKPPS